jgi:hypothetical protein
MYCIYITLVNGRVTGNIRVFYLDQMVLSQFFGIINAYLACYCISLGEKCDPSYKV